MHLYSLIDAYALRQDGSKPLTANWDAGPYKLTARQFESNIATGTAPLLVASTTLVSNLNADYWDGYQFADYLNQAVKTTDNVTFDILTVTQGIAAESLVINTDLLEVNPTTHRIGINKANPQRTLDIYGDVRITGLVGSPPLTGLEVIGGAGEEDYDGGSISLTGGLGGTALEEAGKKGGDVELTGGAGGAGTAALEGGYGGDIILTAGAAGADNGGGAGVAGIVEILSDVNITADLTVDTNLIKTVSATNRIGFNVTLPTVSFDFLGTTLFTGPAGTVGAAPTAFTVVGGEGAEEAAGGPVSIRAGGGGIGGTEEGQDPGSGGDLTLGGGLVGADGGGGVGDATDGVVRFVTDATLVTSDFLVPSGSTILFTEATNSPIEICSIGTNTLCFSGTVEDYNLFVDFFTAKGDRGDTSLFQIFGYGKKSAFTNSESLVIGWGSGDQEYLIRTNKTGDGLAKPLNIYTYGNANQIYLNTDGSTNMGDATNYTKIKSDGEINLHGTARITNALWIGAEGVRAPPTKPAAFVDHGISGAWEFSDATDDTIVANMRIPNRMDRTAAPTIALGWSSTTLSAFCEWQIEYLWRSADEDTTAAADDTLLSSTDADASTSSGTAEGMVLTTFTLTAPSATDICLHLRIKRRGDLAADTINGDTVELHGICMNFTSNKLGTAT